MWLIFSFWCLEPGRWLRDKSTCCIAQGHHFSRESHGGKTELSPENSPLVLHRHYHTKYTHAQAFQHGENLK